MLNTVFKYVQTLYIECNQLKLNKLVENVVELMSAARAIHYDYDDDYCYYWHVNREFYWIGRRRRHSHTHTLPFVFFSSRLIFVSWRRCLCYPSQRCAKVVREFATNSQWFALLLIHRPRRLLLRRPRCFLRLHLHRRSKIHHDFYNALKLRWIRTTNVV